jgi:hypothetical protein
MSDQVNDEVDALFAQQDAEDLVKMDLSSKLPDVPVAAPAAKVPVRKVVIKK